MVTTKRIDESTAIDGVQVEYQASLSASDANTGQFAFKTDGLPYAINAAGTEYDLSGGGSSPLTTKGDLYTYDSADARLAVGGNGKILVSDSGETTGLKWLNPYAILANTESQGTNGGATSSTTYNNLGLDAPVYNPDSIVSVSSNQMTPISGDYIVIAHQQWLGGASVGGGFLRLYNVTGTSEVLVGANDRVAANESSQAWLFGKFTANGTDAYRFDLYTVSGRASYGLGFAENISGRTEKYFECYLIKVG